MYLVFFCALISTALVSPHVFIGEPAPFQWDLPVEKLIMPMNGDPNYEGPEWASNPSHARVTIECRLFQSLRRPGMSEAGPRSSTSA